MQPRARAARLVSVKVQVAARTRIFRNAGPGGWSGDLCEEPVTFRGGDAGVSCYTARPEAVDLSDWWDHRS